MSKKLSRIVCLVVSLLMILSLAACGTGSGTTANTTTIAETTAAVPETTKAPEPVTISMQTHYNNDNEKQPVDIAIAQLKTDFPNVTLQVEGYNTDPAVMKARVASGDLPDIFEIDNSLITQCISTSSIIPLDDYVTKYGIMDILSPAVAGTLKYTDGKIWGIPVYGPMYHTMFYNKDVFDSNGIKLPTNFNELLDVVKAFNAKGITPIAISGKTVWAAGALFEIFAQRINPRGFMAIQDGSAKAADFKDAVVKIETLVKANAFQKGAATADYDSTRAPFQAGKAAMLIIGEWEVSEGQKDLGDKLQYFDNNKFPVMDAGKEYANPGIMPGGTIFDSFAFTSKIKDPDYVAQVFSKYYKYYQEAQFTKMQVIWSTIKTDGLTPEKPFAALVTKYAAEKNTLKPGGNTWLGFSANQKFDTGLAEEIQKLLAGEKADDFIANVDKLAASSK